MNTAKREAAPANNLTVTLTVDQPPEAAFAAINDVSRWWSGEIDGTTDELGGEFTYRYKGIHYSKQKVTELVPGKKVTWLVLESHLSFLEDKTEWTDTQMTFEIAPKGDKTEIRFTHAGLTPKDECFGVCLDAWGSLIKGGLRDLIAAGKGQPIEKKTRKPPRATARMRPEK
jgi:uncharacterized protein YndB with AHSA1/START domain